MKVLQAILETMTKVKKNYSYLETIILLLSLFLRNDHFNSLDAHNKWCLTKEFGKNALNGMMVIKITLFLA